MLVLSCNLGEVRGLFCKIASARGLSPARAVFAWAGVFYHPRSFDKFEFQNIKTSAKLLGPQMFSNKKLINYKVVVLIEIYNFGFSRFFIQGCLKILVLKILKL